MRMWPSDALPALLCQRIPERVEVQQAELQRQPVPGDELVDEPVDTADYSPQHLVAAGRYREPSIAQTVGGAGVVDGLARPVEVAERAEEVGGVPGVEGPLVDEARVGDRLGAAGVGLAQGQDRDRNRLRGLLGPLHGRVFDGRRPVVDVALNAYLEAYVATLQAPAELAGEKVGIHCNRLRSRCGARRGADHVAHGKRLAPTDRTATPVGLQRETLDLPPRLENVSQ